MWAKAGRVAIGSGSGAPGTTYPTDGFTLIFNANQSVGELMSYLLIGGPGVSGHVAEAQITASTTSTAVTGIGFQPELLIVWHCGEQVGGVAGISGDVDDNGLGAWAVGASDGTTQFCAAAFSTYTGIEDIRMFRDNRILSVLGPSSEVFNATLSTFDSGGFTLTHASYGNAVKFKYLALRDTGGSFKVGIETQKTSTGTKATTGVGFQPSGLLFLGAGHATSNAVQNDCTHCVGVAARAEPSGIAQHAESSSKIWNNSGSNSVWTKADRCLMHVTPAEPPGAANAEAEVDSFDTDGFTLDWLVADATARKFGYIAFSGEDSYDGDTAWVAISTARGRSSDGYANQTIAMSFGAQVRGGGAMTMGHKNHTEFVHAGSYHVSDDSELGVWPEDLRGTWRIYDWLSLGEFVPQIIRHNRIPV